MDGSGWDRIAAWRDRRMGDAGDLWHRAIIDPTVREVVGPVRGLRVLDLGCGNGYLTRRWAREGAARSVGVDGSAASLRYARRREHARPTGAQFLRRDAAALVGLEDGSFDAVVANMSLMDIADLEGAVLEAARVLAPTGRFVFAINHPCFDVDGRSAWVVERVWYEETVARKVAGYREARAVRVPWKLDDGSYAYTTGYHRPLPSYFAALRSAGLAVTRLEEPWPLPEAVAKSPQGRFLMEVPLHLVVEAVPRPPAIATRGSRTSARTPGRASLRSAVARRRRGSGSTGRGSRPGS